MASSIQRPTKDSSILLRVGVSGIGHRSSSTDCGGLTLGIGTTLALFHSSGTVLERTEALKIQHIGSQKAKANFFNIQFG